METQLLEALKTALVVISQHYPENSKCCENRIAQIIVAIAAESSVTRTIPSPSDLLADPCTPFWAQRLIKELMDKDPLDAAQVLAVLAQSFGQRAHQLLKRNA